MIVYLTYDSLVKLNSFLYTTATELSHCWWVRRLTYSHNPADGALFIVVSKYDILSIINDNNY